MADVQFEPFRPRGIMFQGVRDVANYGVKIYSIVYGQGPWLRGAFEGGFRAALAALPTPARAQGVRVSPSRSLIRGGARTTSSSACGTVRTSCRPGSSSR